MLISAVLVLGPTALGALCGLGAGRLRHRQTLYRVLVLVMIAGPAELVWLLGTTLPHVGTWDVVAGGTLFVVGAALGLARPSRANVGVAVVATVISLLVVEAFVRVALTEPPTYPEATEARLVFDERRVGPKGPALALATGRPWRCEALYPDLYKGYVANRAERDSGGQPRVLHIGDSMVHGIDVERPFPQLLDQTDSAAHHINAGVSSTGPDYHLLLTRRWMEQQQVDLVAHHVYLGNDFEEIDQSYYCCAGGPILDFSVSPPTARCPEPQYGMGFVELLATSPAPYAVRVATSFSWLARHVCRMTSILGVNISSARIDLDLSMADFTATAAKLEAIITALHAETTAHGARYVLFILPADRELIDSSEDTRGGLARARAIRAVAAKLGIDVFDARSTLAGALRSGGYDSVYLPAENHHFNEGGHQLYADWVQRRLAGLRPRK